jgi:hypothetical protein
MMNRSSRSEIHHFCVLTSYVDLEYLEWLVMVLHLVQEKHLNWLNASTSLYDFALVFSSMNYLQVFMINLRYNITFSENKISLLLYN